VYSVIRCYRYHFITREKERALEGYLKDCNDQLRRLRSSGSDKLMAFDSDMRALVTALERNRSKFTHPPKGPIGSLIALKDYRWSLAVEQVVKLGTLKAFVVDNQTDADTYNRIAKGACRAFPPEVIVSRFQDSVYDVSRNVSHVLS